MSSNTLEAEVREILEHYGKGRAEAGLNRAKIIHKLAPNLAITNYCVGHGLAVSRQGGAALPFLQRAVELSPKNADYLLRLGLTQLETGNLREAEATLERVRKINSKLVNGQWALGIYYASIDRFDKSATHFKRVIDADLPGNLSDGARLDWCRALVQNGKVDDAKEILRDLVTRPAMKAKALARLVDIEPFPLDSADFAEIEKELQGPWLDGWPRSLLLAAKAKCYNAVKDYEREYRLISESKSARGSEFDPRRFEERVNGTMSLFKPGTFERVRKLMGDSDFSPIFVLGMPRSGTTLTERILARHTKVGGAGELSLIANFLARCLGNNAPGNMVGVMESRGAAEIQSLAREIEETMRFLCPGKDRIVDKMPGNFQHIGWICALFPKAKIIHCYRDPADNMLSGFKAALNTGHSYFDRPDWFIAYYKNYVKLMRFWYELLPGRIYPLNYEKLVTEPKEQIKALLKNCKLSWQEDCLYPEENESRILTASVMQARSPINARSVGGWKKYASHLQEIHDQLSNVMPVPE